MIERPKYLDWMVKDREWEDQWSYRKSEGYPPGDAPEDVIWEFIKDAKRAEKQIEEDLIERGASEKEAWRQSCQFPIKDDAPLEIIRDFIGYMYLMQESDGIDY